MDTDTKSGQRTGLEQSGQDFNSTVNAANRRVRAQEWKDHAVRKISPTDLLLGTIAVVLIVGAIALAIMVVVTKN